MMFIVLAVVLALGSPAFCQDPPIPTVPELVTERYIGPWFQMFSNRLNFIYQYEATAVCGTTQYAAFNSSHITVRNWSRNNTGDGPVDEIRGFASRTAEPGQYVLDLEGVPSLGTYWVIKLGPVTDEDQYDYSVVTTSGSDFLYVLARDEPRFRSTYQTEVLQFLEEKGFTGYWKEPVMMRHDPELNCQYAQFP